MKTLAAVIFVAIVLAVLFAADTTVHNIFGKSDNEQNEKARKKLLEKEEMDIELDGDV